MKLRGRLSSRLAVSFLLGCVALVTAQCASPEPPAGESPAHSFTADFASPTGTARPMFRWWWPGGLVDPDEVVRELHQIADAGFGGVEIADVWDSAVTIDPVEYGFGTEAWNTAVEAALRAAKERGLRVDLTIGPHWPSVVPSENPDGAEFAKEIVHGQLVVAGGSTYAGAVPEPVVEPKPYIGEKTLIALQAFRCSEGCGEKPVVLDVSSLVDLTGSVSDGPLEWTAPEGGEWVVIAFWMRGTGQRSAMYGPNPSNSPLTDPDAYVVDHYGKAGTDAVIAYWDERLLTPSIRALLGEVGGAIFEDSLELQSNGVWTPELLEDFQQRRGYSLRPYLALTVGTVAAGFPPRREDAFSFGGDVAERVLRDYEQTLSELWLERRIAPFSEWAHSLGMEYRNQGYGEPVDSILSAATTDVPEGESLGFGDNAMDAFRALAAGRDLGGRHLLSDEVGAYFDGAYATTWHQMLSTMNANYAGGVNQMVLHGFAYADGPNAKWPGFQPFSPFGGREGRPPGPGFAEGWGPRQPTWIHIQDISGYLARTQSALQAGRALVDVAIYRQDFNVGRGGPYLADPSLARAGYTYGFVSPGVLDLPAATVEAGRLAPSGPSYAALVLNQQATLPVETARRILGYARAGLPVVVVGETPTRTPGFAEAEARDAELEQVVADLLAESAVRRVAAESDIAAALREAGVRPAAEPAEPTDLVSVRRLEGDVEVFYLYNPGDSEVQTTLALAAQGQAYALDAWTGAIRALDAQGQNGRTSVALRLGPRDTALFAVAKSGGLAGVDAAAEMPAPASPSEAEPQTLSAWHLVVEDWRPGDSATETRKESHEVDLETLAPWSEIPGLEDVSGIGRYTTTLTLDGEWPHATLDLGRVVDTCRVTVNGQALPPVDPMDPRVDVGPLLQAGDNTITVEVATPLGNRLREANPTIFGRRPRDAYGLLGPVRLVP